MLIKPSKNGLLRIDPDKRLVFSLEKETRLRQDTILYSTMNKLLIIIEYTVPWESRLDEAYERINLKYSDLCDNCREMG